MAERIGQTRYALDFERPLIVLEDRIEELKRLGVPQLSEELRLLEERALHLRHEIFANLTPWQKVQLSRHPQRPLTQDYIDRIFEGFVELHGDRAFQDDAAVVGGLAWLSGPADPAGSAAPRRQAVLVLGHQKGRGTKENVRRNFGMPRPEGYRKGLRLMATAARLRLPIITFIDTPGAFPGIDAEERGQAEAIAKNLEVMARLPVPILSVVIGEGGSGGALALGVADRLLMLEYAVYSVISPEGCASILWKDQGKVETAAREMRMTADQIRALGIADEVIAEPTGGAHRGPAQVEATAAAIKDALLRHLGEVSPLPQAELLASRYAKYRAMGAFVVDVD